MSLTSRCSGKAYHQKYCLYPQEQDWFRNGAFDDYIRNEIQSQHIPGVAIAVIRNGTVLKMEAYGLANIENGIPVTTGTVFQIGSLSKQFIATGVVLLVQDRKINLDDKVNKYLAVAPRTWDAITVRHLLTHTSGLIREGPGFDPYKVQPDIDVIRTAYPNALLFKTGEKYEYCSPIANNRQLIMETAVCPISQFNSVSTRGLR